MSLLSFAVTCAFLIFVFELHGRDLVPQAPFAPPFSQSQNQGPHNAQASHSLLRVHPTGLNVMVPPATPMGTVRTLFSDLFLSHCIPLSVLVLVHFHESQC
jgi:hypothetical protein